jgi:dimethylargininase
MLIAITRRVSPAIVRCELTHLRRAPIDVDVASSQHRAYETALASCGVEVRSLPADAELPDSVFVEDTAIVFDQCAVIARPGAESRRPETVAIARALAPHRKLFHLQTPGTVDGGDMLRVGNRVFVGRSTRTNRAGVEQLRTFLPPHGLAVEEIAIDGCLHLKSAVTQVAADTLLINPAWVSKAAFPGLKLIEVDPSEPSAANVLRICDPATPDTILYQPQFPRTLARLTRAGLRVVLVDLSELGKAEGALSCCSLIFRA